MDATQVITNRAQQSGLITVSINKHSANARYEFKSGDRMVIVKVPAISRSFVVEEGTTWAVTFFNCSGVAHFSII